MDTITVTHTHTPCGGMVLGACGERLCLCDWEAGKRRQMNGHRIQRYFNARFVKGDSPVLQHAIIQLEEYFAGQRHRFDIAIALSGSDFQNRVWRELLSIPYGTVVSYGELATRVGSPHSARAVAAACGANPISIFVPCHRVIGSDRRLTGYGGGLETKRTLLELESGSQNLVFK